MTASPSDPQSAGSPLDPEQIPIALTFEDKLQLFWRRHRVLVIAACLGIAAAIIGVGVYDYMEAQREADVQKAYAAASTPESLKAFTAAHPDHVLAGAAYLRLADDAFAAGKAADAVPNYEKAIAILKDGPFAVRAKLGLAVAKMDAGKAPEGTTELKQLADDANQLKGIRAEAAYHLASVAAANGVSADVQKYTDLLMQIDPMSPWTQRGFALRATLPAPAPTAESKTEAPSAPAIQFAPTGKK
jgi:predicted negative regulator of RcsB-dependent stress response